MNRSLVGWGLILSVGLSSPAQALRVPQPEETQAGLEEDLLPGKKTSPPLISRRTFLRIASLLGIGWGGAWAGGGAGEYLAKQARTPSLAREYLELAGWVSERELGEDIAVPYAFPDLQAPPPPDQGLNRVRVEIHPSEDPPVLRALGTGGLRPPAGRAQTLVIRAEPEVNPVRVRLEIRLPDGSRPHLATHNVFRFFFERPENVARLEAALIGRNGDRYPIRLEPFPGPAPMPRGAEVQATAWVGLVDVQFPWADEVRHFGPENPFEHLEVTLIPVEQISETSITLTPGFLMRTYTYAVRQHRRAVWGKSGMWLGGLSSLSLAGWLAYRSTRGREDDEAFLQKALPSEGLARQGWVAYADSRGHPVFVVRVEREQPVSTLYLHGGLPAPGPLPVGVQLRPLPNDAEGISRMWRESPPEPDAIVIWNGEQVNTAEAEALMPSSPFPLASVVVRPSEYQGISFRELVQRARIAQRIGRVLEMWRYRVSYLQIGPSLYAIVRST